MTAPRLADVLDVHRDDERRRAVRALLRRPLLTPSHEHFTLVRRHATWVADWFARETGWSLHVTAGAARLRKTPATHSDGTRGVAGMSRRRYVLACLCLGALERAEAQVTLGWLAERLIALSADPTLDEAGFTFTLDPRQGRIRDQRGDLVAVARLLLGLGVLVKVAGDEQAFVNSSGDALYDVDRHVLATLLIARRGPSTVDAAGLDARLAAISEDVVADTDEARNRTVRHALARRLLDDPVTYFAELTDAERAYLTSQRGHLLRRLTEGTGFVAEVRAEGIALLDPTGEATDLGMPEEGTDGHATLMVAEYLAGIGRAATTAEIEAQVAMLAARFRSYWRKNASLPELAAQAVARLAALGLVRVDGDRVVPLPALARFAFADPTVTGASR